MTNHELAWAGSMFVEATLMQPQCTTRDWERYSNHAGNSDNALDQRRAEGQDRFGI